jgi:hypothetical protein
VQRLHSAPSLGLARAALHATSARLPADELAIQDRARRHWFKA